MPGAVIGGEEQPARLVGFSTLTHTGLGPALAGFFTEDDNLAQTLFRVAADIRDPARRLLCGGATPID